MVDTKEAAAFFGPGRTAIWRGKRQFAHVGTGLQLSRQGITVGHPDFTDGFRTRSRLLAHLHEGHGDGEADKDGRTDAREELATHVCLLAARSVARTIAEEATQLFARLRLGRCAFGSIERLRPTHRCQRGGEIGQLACLQSQQLISGLRRLQSESAKVAAKIERDMQRLTSSA